MQMKLTLILLVCLVGVTYQQGYPWSPIYSPRLFYYPSLNQFNYVDPSTIKANENPESRSNFGDKDSLVPDIQARIPFRDFNKPQLKFFPTSLFPTSLFPFNFRTLTFTTLTTTVMSTISSTAVIATVQACIPSTMFLTQAGLITLTNPCARRRRNILGFNQQIEEDEILPSAVLPLAATSEAPNFARYEAKPEISSSYSDYVEKPRLYIDINDRQNRALNIVVTTTATITTYSFSTTVIKKTVSLSGPNALSCLPIGYSVC